MESVEIGIWNGYVEKIEHNLFGSRVAILFAVHRSLINEFTYEFKSFKWKMHNSKIYVDSGQAGIYEGRKFFYCVKEWRTIQITLRRKQ